MSIEPGTMLGPYEIEKAIGAGGMGEVYQAHDTRLDRAVAIKVLAPHLAEKPEHRQRLEREAKAISSLSHPHICHLYDVGHEDGVDFLVMEFIEGETLADRLARGPLPIDEVLRYGVQIADALEKAHRQGIVHRDLKPANVMLTTEGAKLLDFGLARTDGAVGGSDADLTVSPTVSKPLTAAGTLIGTYQYMAPEQLEGKTSDARTDLFALGAVLYEMATGRRAFVADTQASLIGAIMHEKPQPVSSIQPMTPPAFDRVIQSCLAKDPEERWQTAHDVKLQLQWIAEGGSVVGLPAPVAARRKSRERLAWIAFAIAVLAAAFLTVGYVRRAPAPPLQTRFEITPPPDRSSPPWARRGSHPTVGTWSSAASTRRATRSSGCGRWTAWMRGRWRGPRVREATVARCGPPTAGTSPSSSAASSRRCRSPADRRRPSAMPMAPTGVGALGGKSFTTERRARR